VVLSYSSVEKNVATRILGLNDILLGNSGVSFLTAVIATRTLYIKFWQDLNRHILLRPPVAVLEHARQRLLGRE
jgi:hypothetical protein